MLDPQIVNSPKFQEFLSIFGLTEQPGVTPSQGYDLGSFTGTSSRSGSLNDTNPVETYTFKVDQTSDFILGLRNLSADVDVVLGKDLDSNGFIDFDEEIDTSEQEGTVDESLNAKLTPGNYLVDVYLFEEGNTTYNLDLSLNSFATPTEALGQSLAGATNVGTLNGIDPLTGTLNNAKPSDIYRFNLDESRDFSIFLDGVSADSNLQLIQDFNNNQIIDNGEVINTSVASSTNAGVIAYTNQQAGTYFARIQSGNPTNYNLSLEAPGSGNTGNEIVTAISANESIQDNLLLSASPNTLIPGAVFYDYQLTDIVGNQQVNISLTSTEFDPALQLINAETGELIAQNDNSNGTNAALSFTVDPNIDYRILVTSFAGEGNNTGAFNLTTTSSTFSGNLGLGQTQNGLLATSDLNDDAIFFDEYQLTGITPGQAVELSVNSTEFDTYLELVDANTGLVVAENDDISNPTNRNSTISFIADPGESFIARVTTFDSNATGNYSLSLNSVASARQPIAQAANSPADNAAFFNNIVDEQIRNIAQQRASSGQLNRNGMLAIFNQITSDNQVTTAEISDLKTLLKEKNAYIIPDSVQYLGKQVATKATQDVGQFNQLVAQHFLGTVRPEPIYQETNNDGSPKGNPVSYTYQPVQGKLFGEGGPKIGDIAQNPFGNCYYVAGLGSMFARQNFTAATIGTNFKGDTSSAILTETITANTNDSGQLDNTYTVRFYNENGQAEYVTVDNQLIIDDDGKIAGSARDTSVNNPNNILWVPILERAFTQWQGGYNKVMNGGDPGMVQQQIKSGSKSDYYTAPDAGQEIGTFEVLATAFNEGKTVTAGTPDGKNTIFYSNHAYTVANAYVNEAGEQRVVVFNPHGQDSGGNAGVNGEYKDIRVTAVREDGFVDVSFAEFKQYMGYFFVV
ncbi:MAG TPA: pre-peptidase C-terminal domain-containing protein [Halomicronema sp.]